MFKRSAVLERSNHRTAERPNAIAQNDAQKISDRPHYGVTTSRIRPMSWLWAVMTSTVHDPAGFCPRSVLRE